MNRLDGTAARQLNLINDANIPLVTRPLNERGHVQLRVLRKDLYAELTKRRRRAQIAARRALETP